MGVIKATWCSTMYGEIGIGLVKFGNKPSRIVAVPIDGLEVIDDLAKIKKVAEWGGRVDVEALREMIKIIDEEES